MQIFTNTANVHAYNLRNSELNYYIPRPRTEFGKGEPTVSRICSMECDFPCVQNFAQPKRL